MINSLRGILKEVSMTELTVDVGGVGYEVFIPLSTFDKLPRKGENIELYIYTHIREDAIQLYGFATELEKKIFLLLMNEVSGIGPKLALNVLSSVSPETLCTAIREGNAKALSKISGIGKKTAERMILELKGKMKAEYFAPLAAAATGSPADAKIAKACEEAALALTQLGFKYENAVKAVHELAKEMKESEITAENMIRQALLKLNS